MSNGVATGAQSTQPAMPPEVSCFCKEKGNKQDFFLLSRVGFWRRGWLIVDLSFKKLGFHAALHFRIQINAVLQLQIWEQMQWLEKHLGF